MNARVLVIMGWLSERVCVSECGVLMIVEWINKYMSVSDCGVD